VASGDSEIGTRRTCRELQLWGCFFEDDVGRAENKRTGLSCPDHQSAQAKQCLKRCANNASDTTHLVCTDSYPNTVWYISFGDISGDAGDSARVDLWRAPAKIPRCRSAGSAADGLSTLMKPRARGLTLISVSLPQHLFGFLDGTAFLIRPLGSSVQACKHRGEVHS
jgi:hypothetical protein